MTTYRYPAALGSFGSRKLEDARLLRRAVDVNNTETGDHTINNTETGDHTIKFPFDCSGLEQQYS